MSNLQSGNHQAQGLLRLAQLYQQGPAAASDATVTAASSAATDINAILAGVVPAEKRLRTTVDTSSVVGSENSATACGRCTVLQSELAVARSELDRAALMLLSERRRAEDAEARFRSLQGAVAGSAGGWTMTSAAALSQAQLSIEAALQRATTSTRAGTSGGTAAAFPPSIAASLAKVGTAVDQVELAAAAVALDQQQRLSAAAAAAPAPIRLGGLLDAAARGPVSPVGSSGAAAVNDRGGGGRDSPQSKDAVGRSKLHREGREASDKPGGDGTPSPGTDADTKLKQINRESGRIMDANRVMNGKPEATKNKVKKMLQDAASENPKISKPPSLHTTYRSLSSTPRPSPPSLPTETSTLASASAGDDRKRKSPSLPRSTALEAVTAEVANVPPASVLISVPKPCLPPHHPGAVAAAATAAASSNISTRRGDPRMNRAVAAKLTNPSSTLLDALLEGGFIFPLDHSERERGGRGGGERSFSGNDKTIVDAEGVSLYQRKNQLNRRLRRAKMEHAERLNSGEGEGGSIIE